MFDRNIFFVLILDMKRILFFLLIASHIAGCAHVIPKELRQQVDKTITREEIFKNPDALKGKTVILGGVIMSISNLEDKTYVEVLESPLDSYGKPGNIEESKGRFMVLYEGYLEPAIYSTGKRLTVFGEISGKKSGSIGERTYDYPLIKAKELYLFKPEREIPVRFGIGIFKSF